MSLAKTLVIQGCLVVSIVASGLWASTQWAAAMLGHQPRLGAPWVRVLGEPIYHPWRLLVRWFACAPAVLRKAGILAAGSGQAAMVEAMADSLWRARRMKIVAAHGSTRFVTAKEIRAVNLLSGHCGLLSKLGLNYLPDDLLDPALTDGPFTSEDPR
jgi:type IV secretion system protein VirD4